MELRITATALARTLGDVLGKIRFRQDTFVIERNGEPVARLVPLPSAGRATLGEALRAWREAGDADPEFAADLEQVNRPARQAGEPGSRLSYRAYPWWSSTGR